MRPLLGLSMMVKDEAANIRATLESVKPFVKLWAILDTGSTDGTQALVREVMAGEPTGIKGKLIEGPFVDFATCRNQTLNILSNFTESPIFILTLSGDEVLENGEALRAFLEEHRGAPEGAYALEMKSLHASWLYPRILRVDAGWRYQGLVHEVPVGPNKETTGPTIPNVRVVHTVTDLSRRFARMRDYDFPILQREVADESKSLTERAQAIWFLAQTHEAIADEYPRIPGGDWISHKMAAMALYLRRAELGGEDEFRVFYCMYRYLDVAAQIGRGGGDWASFFYSDAELISRLEPLCQSMPTLPEIRYLLARHAAFIDARRGGVLAEEAARVAKEAKAHPTSLPTDGRVEWLSLRLAAQCAKKMNRSVTHIKELAERGIAAGGAPEAFEEFLK